MPAFAPLPTIAELVAAFGDGLRVDADRNADARAGSNYDALGGPSAIIAAREAARDRDLFRQAYFDTAVGERLYEFAERKGVAPQRASRGRGSVTLRRDTTGGTDIPRGTRVALESAGRLVLYETDEPRWTPGSTVTIAIRATDIGPGFAANTTDGARVVDVLPVAWRVLSLRCTDGTVDEDPANLRERCRVHQRRQRPGMRDAIVDAALEEGAGHVQLFTSLLHGPEHDTGVSVAYVAPVGLALDYGLARRVMRRLEGSRVAGADLHVLPMISDRLQIDATATIGDTVSRLNTAALRQIAVEAILAEFERRDSPYTYRLTALEGAVIAATSGAITALSWTLPASEPAITPRAWPAILTRWTLRPNDIRIRF